MLQHPGYVLADVHGIFGLMPTPRTWGMLGATTCRGAFVSAGASPSFYQLGLGVAESQHIEWVVGAHAQLLFLETFRGAARRLRGDRCLGAEFQFRLLLVAVKVGALRCDGRDRSSSESAVDDGLLTDDRLAYDESAIPSVHRKDGHIGSQESASTPGAFDVIVGVGVGL